jgi:hypothetical protein
MQNIDFEPLSRTNKVTIDSGSMDVSAIRGYFANRSNLTLGLWIAGFLVLLTAAYILLSDFGFDMVAFGAAIFIAVIIHRLSRQKMLAWREFAKANGWMVLEPIKVSSAEKDILQIPAAIAEWVGGQKSTEVVTGAVGGNDFSIYSYMPKTGSDRPVAPFTVFSMPLNYELPRILIISKKVTSEGISKEGLKENLKLEGDFNNYFSVHIAKGTGVNALTILTPDVMQQLTKEAPEYIIDISNKKLNVLSIGDNRNTKDLPILFKVSLDLLEQIKQNIH